MHPAFFSIWADCQYISLLGDVFHGEVNAACDQIMFVFIFAVRRVRDQGDQRVVHGLIGLTFVLCPFSCLVGVNLWSFSFDYLYSSSRFPRKSLIHIFVFGNLTQNEHAGVQLPAHLWENLRMWEWLKLRFIFQDLGRRAIGATHNCYYLYYIWQYVIFTFYKNHFK